MVLCLLLGTLGNSFVSLQAGGKAHMEEKGKTIMWRFYSKYFRAFVQTPVPSNETVQNKCSPNEGSVMSRNLLKLSLKFTLNMLTCVQGLVALF